MNLNDYNVGLQYEVQILPFLQVYFNDKTIVQLDRFNVFDFKGENKYLELKTRKCSVKTYPTTMIGVNKVERAKSLNENVYFIFQFTDGVYCWKYDKNIQLTKREGGRTDRGYNEIKQYFFISTQLLIKIG